MEKNKKMAGFVLAIYLKGEKMLNKLILIEGENYKQFSNEKELVEYMLGDNYYSLSEKEKQILISKNAIFKCYGKGIEIVKYQEKIENFKNKFIIYDEKSYILSLLLADQIKLLESKDANIYAKEMDKTNFEGNYIILNNFAEELLKKYLEKQI